jgi:triacylglycerol lipase
MILSMDTRRLVDPQLLPILDLFPKLDLSAESLPAVRAELDTLQLPGVVEPRADVITICETVPGPPGGPDVDVIVSRPADPSDTPRPALYWIHGGGYVIGAAAMNTALMESFVAELGCVTVSVDYRLAPETPHPGPIEDCYAGLRWLHDKATDLGVDPARVVIAGESAGAGLAAALAVLVRDRAGTPIVAQLLVYPMLDDRVVTDPDPNPYTGEFIWSRPSNAVGWQCLLGDVEPGSAAVSPYAAAARVTDPAGLAPAFIAVGALDLFLDEDVAYASRLLRAGVPTELHVYPGAVHGFMGFIGTNLAIQLRTDMLRVLRRYFMA